MGFHNFDSRKLLKRGRNKLPMRSRQFRRSQLLRQFDVARVYSFAPIYELDELPEGTTLWEVDYFDEVIRYV